MLRFSSFKCIIFHPWVFLFRVQDALCFQFLMFVPPIKDLFFATIVCIAHIDLKWRRGKARYFKTLLSCMLLSLFIPVEYRTMTSALPLSKTTQLYQNLSLVFAVDGCLAV